MIMVRPDKKASLRDARHRIRPFQIGGLPRIELVTNRRMDAVGRDQQCAIVMALRFAVAL